MEDKANESVNKNDKVEETAPVKDKSLNCVACNGEGLKDQSTVCPVCNGTGKTTNPFSQMPAGTMVVTQDGKHTVNEKGELVKEE